MTSARSAVPLLEVAHASKRFGPVVAADEASLTVMPGSVHALLGENGAGKTTVAGMAFGLLRPDAGTIRVRGVPLVARSPRDAIALGVGMVHQHFSVVPALTVAENVALGGRGRYDVRRAREVVRETAGRTGLALDPDARAGDLPVGGQQRLEILKALARDATILILDEPTAVLTPIEAAELLAWVRRFADTGNAALLITHKLNEALGIADHVTVLRRGRVILESPTAATSPEALAAAVVGGGTGAVPAPAAVEPVVDAVNPRSANATPVVTADRLSVRDARGHVAIHDATFVVYGGEIVGVAAVDGSGDHALLEALAGLAPPAKGSLHLPPSIGYVPQDRHRHAVAAELSLTENVALRGAGLARGRMRWRDRARTALALVQRFDVRTPGVEVPLFQLSGGNQQRVVLARELAGDPPLVVAADPTRGLDLGATAFVHEQFRAAARRGGAVVFHSADLDEVLALSNRVLVVHSGRVREVAGDREAVSRAMLGVDA